MVVLSIALLSACGTGDKSTGASEQKTKTYTVATDSNFKPFEYKNTKTGEMEGFDIDLIKEIAKRAEFNVKFESMQFDGLIAGMKSGRYPIGIAGISITDDRKKSIAFSDPYYDSGIVLMVSKESEIHSIDDVGGKKIGTRQGSTSQAYLKDKTKAQVEAFPEIVNAYMDVKTGRLDAALYDLPNVLYFIKQQGGGKVKTTGDVLEGQSYGIAFPKNSDLVDDVNAALKKIIADGTYAKIYKKYFGTEPSEKWQGK